MFVHALVRLLAVGLLLVVGVAEALRRLQERRLL